jgi:hypothetical protein
MREVFLMRTAALVLGIVGGIMGIVSALIVFGLGQGSDPSVGTVALLTLGFALLGLWGGWLSRHRPRVGALCMVVAALGLLFSVSFLAALPIIVFLVGAGVAFFASPPSAPDREILHT